MELITYDEIKMIKDRVNNLFRKRLGFGLGLGAPVAVFCQSLRRIALRPRIRPL